jgi:aldehyde:ferredoxin oxidoreductase
MQNMEILTFDRASEVIKATTGFSMTSSEVRMVGERIVNIERVFNVREGLTRLDDCLPRRFLEEPLKHGASSGTVVNQEPMLDEYYRERGWNVDTGIPTHQTLKRLRLKQEI